jgi:hypothetical protein
MIIHLCAFFKSYHYCVIQSISTCNYALRCKLGMSKTTLKQITNIKELYTSQLVFFDLMLFHVMCAMRTVVSVSWHNTNPTKRVGLLQKADLITSHWKLTCWLFLNTIFFWHNRATMSKSDVTVSLWIRPC